MGTVISGSEAALARAFADFGYQVITSDDLLAQGLAQPQVLAEAKRGVTAQALKVARAAQADLALLGVVRLSERSVQPAGVSLVMVSGEVSAKAMVVGSGRVLSVFHQTYRASAPDPVMAASDCLNRAADGIAQVLAWKIPQILSEEGRETRLVLHNLGLEQVEAVKRALLDKEIVDDARLVRMGGPGAGGAELALVTGLVGVAPERILQTCQAALARRMQVVAADRFRIELR